MAGDVVGGWLSDMILKRTGNAKLARRGVAAPGFLLAGAFVLPAAMVEDATISILFLATSFFFLEWVIGPAWAVPMDVGGRFSGTVAGVMDMSGASRLVHADRLRFALRARLLGRTVRSKRGGHGRRGLHLDLPDRSWKDRCQRGSCHMIARLAVLVLVAAASLVAQGGRPASGGFDEAPPTPLNPPPGGSVSVRPANNVRPVNVTPACTFTPASMRIQRMCFR